MGAIFGMPAYGVLAGSLGLSWESAIPWNRIAMARTRQDEIDRMANPPRDWKSQESQHHFDVSRRIWVASDPTMGDSLRR
jgi:hypothetical protein